MLCLCRGDREIDGTIRDFDTFAVALSPFVLAEVLRAPAFATLEQKREVCKLLAGIPHGIRNVARGWAFEAYGHACLSTDDPVNFGTYPLTPSPKSKTPKSYRYATNSKRAPTRYPRTTREIRFYDSPDDFANNPAKDGEYCVPFASNRPAFKSFVVTEAAVYIFQMSVFGKDPIDAPAQMGLGWLKRMVPSDRP